MKKKLLVVCAVILLLGIVSYGTLAYFSSTDQVTNTFTVGSVKIVQNEQQHDDVTGELEDFEQDQTLLPVADPSVPENDENYIEKIVTVTSVGKNPAYVRTHIAVPTALAQILTLDMSDSANWVSVSYPVQPTQVVDGVEYTIYSFTYTQPLDQGQSTDVLLEGVYLNANVDMKENEGEPQFCTWNEQTQSFDFYDFDVTEKVHVLVATQGVQSQGFADADSALDAAFPSVPDFNA